MEYEEVVRGRRSIRGYKPDPVPQKVIEEVIALATRCPSSMNTQPWHFYVVTGEPLARIRQGNTERNLAGVTPSREIRSHGAYEGVHRKRQIEIAIQLFQAMGYPDDTFPANNVVSIRRPVAEVASFVGFAESA